MCHTFGSPGYTNTEEIREALEGWTLEMLEQANRGLIKELRTYLLTHKV